MRTRRHRRARLGVRSTAPAPRKRCVRIRALMRRGDGVLIWVSEFSPIGRLRLLRRASPRPRRSPSTKADNELRASDGAEDTSRNGGTIFWSSANASTKRHARNRVQWLSVHTQASSATQLGDARRERDRRGRQHRTAAGRRGSSLEAACGTPGYCSQSAPGTTAPATPRAGAPCPRVRYYF